MLFNRKNIKFALLSVAVLALASVLTLGLGMRKHVGATAGDCSTNSIDFQPINGQCGAANPAEMIADIRANNPGDMQDIYAHFGLTSAFYDHFAQTARPGTFNRDGTIVVDGQVVATSAASMGRHSWPGQTNTISINGHTYYWSYADASLRQGVNSLPVMVMFNDKGVMQTAIMNECGNPAWGTPVVPQYSCKMLNMQPLGDDTYSFTTEAAASDNATIAKVVYDFGDGSAMVTKTSPSEAVTHKYVKPGDYVAKVTVYVNLPGNQQVTVVSAECAKPVKVVPPPPAPKPMCTAPNGKQYEEGSAECEKCKYNQNVSATSNECQPPQPQPTALPNTGPGDILGLFAATSAGGAIAHRVVWSRRSRR